MCWRNVIVTPALDTGPAQEAGAISTRSACGSVNVPFVRCPGSETPNVASPAVETTFAVVCVVYSWSRPGVNAPNEGEAPSATASVAGTVPPALPPAFTYGLIPNAFRPWPSSSARFARPLTDSSPKPHSSEDFVDTPTAFDEPAITCVACEANCGNCAPGSALDVVLKPGRNAALLAESPPLSVNAVVNGDALVNDSALTAGCVVARLVRWFAPSQYCRKS